MADDIQSPTAPPGCAPTNGSDAGELRREIQRLIRLGNQMLDMIQEYHACNWDEEPFTPDIDGLTEQLESPLCCPICKGSGTSDGALGYNGQGPCPRCLPDKWGPYVRQGEWYRLAPERKSALAEKLAECVAVRHGITSLSNEELVSLCLSTDAADFVCVQEMMSRLHPGWQEANDEHPNHD